MQQVWDVNRWHVHVPNGSQQQLSLGSIILGLPLIQAQESSTHTHTHECMNHILPFQLVRNFITRMDDGVAL